MIRSFDFSITTITGEHMHLADTLSRLSNDVDEMEIASVDSFFDVHHSVVPVLRQIRRCNDKEMNLLKKYVVTEWPSYVPTHMAPYNRDRSSYMVHNGCVFRDHHVVVPSQLRSQLLNELRHMHTGVERMRRLV